MTTPDAPVMTTTYVPGGVGDVPSWFDKGPDTMHPDTPAERTANSNQNSRDDRQGRRRGTQKIAMPTRIAPPVAKSLPGSPPRVVAVPEGAMVEIVRTAVRGELVVRVAGFPELKVNAGRPDAPGGMDE